MDNQPQDQKESRSAVEEQPTAAAGGKKRSTGTYVGIIILLVAIISVVLYAAMNMFEGGTPRSQAAAVVNGEVITQEEFESQFAQVEATLSQSGQDFNEEQLAQVRRTLLRNLVNRVLVLQAANDSGLSVNAQQVETTYQQEILAQFEDEEALSQHLAESGSSIEELKESIADQILMQEYLAQQVRGQDTNVSEEEVRAEYDRLSEQTEGEMPPFEDVQSQVRQQLEQQKGNQAAEQLIQELRNSAEIEILI